MNQMKQEGQFLRKEEHLQEEAGGWLWLEQDLESRDCGRKVACLGKEGWSLAVPRPNQSL